MVAFPATPLRLSGDFSGDEKMPSMGSRPCSSRIPVSFNVTPVFLNAAQSQLEEAFYPRAERSKSVDAYLPATPTFE